MLRYLGFNIGMFKELQQSYHQFNILRCSHSENLLAFTLFIRFQFIFEVFFTKSLMSLNFFLLILSLMVESISIFNFANAAPTQL